MLFLYRTLTGRIISVIPGFNTTGIIGGCKDYRWHLQSMFPLPWSKSQPRDPKILVSLPTQERVTLPPDDNRVLALVAMTTEFVFTIYPT